MAEAKGRLTVVEKVYHQNPGKGPTETVGSFSRDLETKQQIYVRYLDATEEWQPLDTGWLWKDVGHLIVQNDEGQSPRVKPTEEELEELAKRVIELSYDPDGEGSWLVPPGESMRGTPSSAFKLFFRCRSGTTEFTLTLVPR